MSNCKHGMNPAWCAACKPAPPKTKHGPYSNREYSVPTALIDLLLTLDVKVYLKASCEDTYQAMMDQLRDAGVRARPKMHPKSSAGSAWELQFAARYLEAAQSVSGTINVYLGGNTSRSVISCKTAVIEYLKRKEQQQ